MFDTRLLHAIQTVKKWMQPFLKDGVSCPCCGKQCRLYGRKLNSGMARLMIGFYRQNPHGWLHVSRCKHIESADLGVVNGDFTYLPHWGLMEPGKDGLWRLTSLGLQFVRGEIEVPHKVFLVNNKCVGKSNETTNIRRALKDNFDYDELMSG